jgi:hypothetical protein
MRCSWITAAANASGQAWTGSAAFSKAAKPTDAPGGKSEQANAALGLHKFARHSDVTAVGVAPVAPATPGAIGISQTQPVLSQTKYAMRYKRTPDGFTANPEMKKARCLTEPSK